jgi:hypothetical protein
VEIPHTFTRSIEREVENLNAQLHYIDALIDQALAHDQDTSTLEDNAIAATSGVLHQVEALRDDYGTTLDAALTDLRAAPLPRGVRRPWPGRSPVHGRPQQ